jgi:transposase-like protein
MTKDPTSTQQLSVPATSPVVCPFCRSAKITGPTDKLDASSYWRCEDCGQMWNVSRQSTAHSPSAGRRWTNDH